MLTKVEDKFLSKYFEIREHLQDIKVRCMKQDSYHRITKIQDSQLDELALECAKASIHAESIGYLQTAVENALKEVFGV